MTWLPIVTIYREGADACEFTGNRDPRAPIRLYPDRIVEDEYLFKLSGRLKRRRLSRKEFSQWRKWARENKRREQPDGRI